MDEFVSVQIQKEGLSILIHMYCTNIKLVNLCGGGGRGGEEGENPRYGKTRYDI